MLIRIFFGLITLLACIIVAGLTGYLFRVWPTHWPDETLTVGTVQIDRLKALRQEPKFKADPKRFYPGAPNELLRLGLEGTVNGVIDYLIKDIQVHPRKSFVLSTFKTVLVNADRLDSEEKDRFLLYFNEIIGIVGISNSNELFNVWRYGLPYGWFIK